MSMGEMVGRIGTIQNMIEQLSRPLAAGSIQAKAPAAVSGANADSGAGFASALASAGLTGSSAASADMSTASGLGQLASALGMTSPAPSNALTAGALAAQAGGAAGNDVVATAKKYIGVPYVWGGTNPATGMDCSGFVQRVFKDLGVEVPRVVSDQMKVGTPVASLAEAKPGDLLVSFGGNHISIYLGNGKAIDAPVPGQTIQIRDAWEQRSDLTAIRRIVPAGKGAS